MPDTREARPLKAIPHGHACYACRRSWPCENTYCVDPQIKWCRHGCLAPSHPSLVMSEAMQDAYHLLDQAGFVLGQGRAALRADAVKALRDLLAEDIAALDRAFRAEVGDDWLVSALANVIPQAGAPA